MSLINQNKNAFHIVITTILIVLVCAFSSPLFAGEKDASYRLYKAAENGNIETVKQLIENGVNVNAENKSGSFALNAAAFKNNHEMIQLLINNGADINSRNRGLDTPLICATKYSNGDKNTVKMLLDAGSDLDAVDEDGKTALDYALKKDQTAAIELLSKN